MISLYRTRGHEVYTCSCGLAYHSDVFLPWLYSPSCSTDCIMVYVCVSVCVVFEEHIECSSSCCWAAHFPIPWIHHVVVGRVCVEIFSTLAVMRCDSVSYINSKKEHQPYHQALVSVPKNQKARASPETQICTDRKDNVVQEEKQKEFLLTATPIAHDVI